MAIVATSLGEQIEQALKEEILGGKLAPGQRLSLDELAERWGVSSMPVRDAVRRLETSGFVKVAPRRGVFVAEFDQSRFKNILDIRIALECLAIELSSDLILDFEIENAIQVYQEGGEYIKKSGDASKLATQDNLVHDLLINNCNNPKLIEIMNGLQDLIDWAHQTVAAYRPDALERALPEHLDILEALKTRDIEATQEAMRTHLKGTLERTLEMWAENGKSD